MLPYVLYQVRAITVLIETRHGPADLMRLSALELLTLFRTLNDVLSITVNDK